MPVNSGSPAGLLYFISALVVLSAGAVIASLFMPWVVGASLFSSGMSVSAFDLSWSLAADDDVNIFLNVLMALIVMCMGIIVIVMVGLSRGGWAVWVKTSLLFLSLVVLLSGGITFSAALGATVDPSVDFRTGQIGSGIFIFALGSLLTFAGCLWGAISLRHPG